jgi:competence protein ComEC
VFLALVGGLLKVVLTLLWPAQAGWWASVAVYPIGWMRGVVDWLSQWTYADVPVPPSPWWLITLFYGLLLLCLVSRLPSWVRGVLRIAPLVVAAFIVIPPLQATVNPAVPSGTTRITLLSVGAGQCAVVQPPGGRTVILDAGSSSLADPVTRCIGPFLRHVRCTGIDSVVLSHGDQDHVGAAEEIVRAYGVREVLTGARFVDHEGPHVRDLVADLERLERPPRILLPEQRNPLGRDTAIEVLWPPAGLSASQASTSGSARSIAAAAKQSSNDGCLVLKVVHAGKTVLFPGDIQDGAMRELLKEPAKLKADVLVAMHHGSAETLTRAFVEAVDPQVIVSSNDRSLTAKQRAFDRIVAGRPLMRTNEYGAITITIDRDGKLNVVGFVKQK